MTVTVEGGTLTKQEIDLYKARAEQLYKGTTILHIKIDGDYVELDYYRPPIQRIRRITGYLTGTVDRWNNAKRAELHDRVMHNTIEDFLD